MSKLEWLPLESEPESFNFFINSLGIKGAKFVDIYGFEDSLLQFVPRPHLALILCYPEYKKVEELMLPVYEKLDGSHVPEKVFFMKQKISNACGTFALIHSITQNTDKLDIGTGPFAEWYKEAQKLSVEERSDSLASSQALATAHESAANRGGTEVGPYVGHHFIAYVNIDNTLYEFDSRMSFPRACGPTTQETLLKDAGKLCTDLAQKLDNASFGALALVGES